MRPANQILESIRKTGFGCLIGILLLLTSGSCFGAFRILEPNGGEVYNIGQTMNIRWTGGETLRMVYIYLSRDGGATWTEIATSRNFYRESWVVTGPSSTRCRIAVGHSLDDGDMSNANFTIKQANPRTVDLYDQGESHRSFEPRTFESGKSGQIITIYFSIANGGNVDAPPSQIAFYASTDTNITPEDYKIGHTGNLSSIGAGSALQFSATRDFPTNIPPGTYYVGWIIDSGNVVAETNESNNIAYKQGYRLVVTDDTPQEQPDLYDLGEQHRSFSPLSAESGKPGQMITIEFAVRNRGKTSSPVVTVAFYVSTDTNITTSDYKLGQSGNLPALAPGQSQAFNATRQLPTNIPPGTYYIGWIIDTGNVADESDESNNTACKQGYQLEVIDTDKKPDLHDMGESYHSFSPTILESGKAGQNITISSVIKNGGTQNSPAVTINFYLSTDTNITTSDYKLGQSGNLPALAPGQNQSFDATRELPLNIPPGTYYVGWIIDVDNVANESNESNNAVVIRSISLVLQDPEDEDTGSIIYVDSRAQGANDGSSWEDAYKSLQDALNAARSPGEIHVAQGVYRPDQGVGINPRDRAASFQLKSNVKVKGGYAGYGAADPDARDVHAYETILSGDLQGKDVDVADPCNLLDEPTRAENSYHVVNANGTNATAELDGFTIEAGNANEGISEGEGDTGQCAQNYGGGLIAGFCGQPGSPRITNCTFRKNSALYDGGGMYTRGGSPLINDCTLESNYAGTAAGGMYCSGRVSITDCVFAYNTAQYSAAGLYYSGTGSITDCAFNNNNGRGLYIEGNGSTSQLIFYPMVGGCLFSDNSGGGLSVGGGSPILIDNCIFQHNQSSSNGGGMYGSDSSFSEVPITLVNCVFRLNEVKPNPQTNNMALGGAIYVDGCTLDIINCTFYMNDADHGDAISAPRSYVNIHNSILWDYDDEVYGGTVSVEYSCLNSRNVPGGGNISEDPRFIDSPSNLQLMTGSPCIDAGDNSVVNCVSDLDGNPRLVDDISTPDTGNGDQPLVDIGAYEYQGYGPGGCIIYVDKKAPGPETGARWPDAFHSLQDALEIAYPGCRIRIGQGTYKPDEGKEVTLGDRKASFHLKNGVVIDGGYAGYGASNPDAKAPAYRAVLSGDLLGNETTWGHSMNIEEPDKEDNSYHVVVGDETNSSAMLRNCVIKHGNANGIDPYWANGGGLINYHGSPTVEGCFFYGNTSRTSGGAACNWGSGADFKDCTFRYNYCSEQGGAMWNYGPDAYNSSNRIMITNCSFASNAAKQNGGAMDNWSYCLLLNCEFESNRAENGDGGAVRIYGAGNEIHQCTFRFNRCSGQGGAILANALYEAHVYGQIHGCTFSDNWAETGGGVSIHKGRQVSMTGCLFQENVVLSYGAAVSVTELQNLNLANCEFRDNASKGDGGGLWQASSGLTDLVNCVFVGNEADQKGGGIYWLCGDLTLINCTFSQNEARAEGDGIFLPATLTKPNLRAANCILWNGSDETLVLESGGLGLGTRNISFSCVEQLNLDGLGEGNITANPLFSEDGRNGNVHLTNSSPCIDAGDNSAIPAGITTDLDDNPRKANGGKGESPIVDMGAYEKQLGELWPMPYDPAGF